MKSAWHSWLESLRQRFVLTPEEQRVIVFVLTAFILGLAAKYYRDSHPKPLPAADTAHRAGRFNRVMQSAAVKKNEKKKEQKKAGEAIVPPNQTAKRP